MRQWSIAFFIGILLLQFFSVLPPYMVCGWLIGLLIIGQCVLLKVPSLNRLFIGVVSGFCWVVLFAHWQNGYVLPDQLEGKTISLRGYVVSIPVVDERGVSFLFKTSQLDQANQSTLIKLTWMKNPIALHVGQEWELTAKLKKIHGQMNPGGYDYEAYAYQKGIRAQGYVVMKGRNAMRSWHWYHDGIDQIRERLNEKINKNLSHSTTSQWIPALAVGERENISPQDWEVLRNTGTNHLMAIAGLHIGFMSALAHFIVQFLWKRSRRLVLFMPAVQAGAVGALVIALVYSALAGFALPTQRACLMLVFFLAGILLRRSISIWQVWFLALLTTLICNPLLILAESFWLSFASVGLILFGMGGRVFPKGLWWKWGRVQWVITIGLIPFSVWLFQEFSLSSFLANCIAIPWVEFLLVPLCFVGSLSLLLSTQLGVWILTLADKLLSVLWVILKFFSTLPHAVWHQQVGSLWMLLAACVGVILMICPKNTPGKFFSVIYILPLLLYQPVKPNLNELSLTLLDVGQGLSAVVQTKNHVLVFDTGPRLSPSYDMGASVLVPYLRQLHIHKIDMLVVSHKDNDHIGGSESLLHDFPVSEIKTSVPEKFTHASYCLRGQQWQWDGINFQFLYPSSDKLNLNNDSSCVLKVSAGDKSVLLTGDIEKFAETQLVENNQTDLPSTLLIAPHHGSKTSGQAAFVNAVHPKIVLFPLGYRNRYHFPHASVIKKYQELDSILYDTASKGAIHFTLENKAISVPDLYRVTHKKYWNN